MTEDQMYQEITDIWMKTIDVLKSAHEVAAENADYKGMIHLTLAIEKCYNAAFGNKPDFEGIDLS